MNLETRLDKLTGWIGSIAPLMAQLNASPNGAQNPLAKTLANITTAMQAWDRLNPVTDPAEVAMLATIQGESAAAQAAAIAKLQASAAAAVAADADPHITTLTDATFAGVLAKGIVIVKVWSDTCAPCAAYRPVFAAAAASAPAAAVFASYLLPRGPSAFRRAYLASPGKQNSGVPLTMKFVDGIEKSRIVGALDSAALAKFIAG